VTSKLLRGKIVQTAIKKGKTWKSTGVHENKFEKFKIDRQLEQIIKKVIKILKIKICGFDSLKKDAQWLILEANCEPGLDFYPEEQEKLVSLTLDFLKKEAKK